MVRAPLIDCIIDLNFLNISSTSGQMTGTLSVREKFRLLVYIKVQLEVQVHYAT